MHAEQLCAAHLKHRNVEQTGRGISSGSHSLLHVYLFWALETDPALGRPQAAGGAGQRHGVQAHLQLGLLVLKRQAPGPRVAAVVLLLIILGMAVDKRRPTAAAHPQTSHGGGPSICV